MAVGADLRFLLALQPGQTAVVLETAPALAAAVEAEGLAVARVAGTPWPLPADSVDHVFLPLARAEPGPLLAEAARVLRANGWLLLGATNRHSLYRRPAGASKTADRDTVLAPGTARSRLQQLGFKAVTIYGVRETLDDPRWLVPLARPEPTCFYFEHRFTPYTAGGHLLGNLALWLARLGMHHWLFRDLVYVGRRREETPS